MKRLYLITLVLLIALPAITYAELKAPTITPEKGQSREQQAADYMESRSIAVQKTGIYPDALQMEMRTLESQLSYEARPVSKVPGERGGRSDSAMPWDQSRKVENTKDRMKEVEKRHKIYLKAFCDELEARGYKVK